MISKKRCAIYTRKSTSEGLDSAFNTLEAQREAALAYIASQKHEGWVALDKEYNDGGFTGANLERPALEELLADVKAGKVDVIVCYKIDRLTRSLMDFSKLVDVFDEHGVSFVSVTQHFNTKDSMGRLTLNILLSFAQFEREVITERVRDKVAASRKKGLFMGGTPPLGYDAVNKALIANAKEAEVVKRIFERFTATQSQVAVAKELNDDGIQTKSWTTQNGKLHMGQDFSAVAIRKILTNVTYLGKAKHKDKVYNAEHEPLVSQDLFNKVQAILAEPKRKRANRSRAESKAFLKGKLFGTSGQAMSPQFSRDKKNPGKRYRYYVDQKAIKDGWSSVEMPSVPADQIESEVFSELRSLFRCPALANKIHQRLKGHSDLLKADVRYSLTHIDELWDELFVAEQLRIIDLMVDRVDLAPNKLAITLHTAGLEELFKEALEVSEMTGETNSNWQLSRDGSCILVTKPVTITKRGGRKTILNQDGLVGDLDTVMGAKVDEDLVRLVAQSWRWNKMLDEGYSSRQIAAKEDYAYSHVARVLRLHSLPPATVSAILHGTHNDNLSVTRLTMDGVEAVWTTA